MKYPDELVQFLTGIEGESFGHIEELAVMFRVGLPVDVVFAPVSGSISAIQGFRFRIMPRTDTG